MDKMKLNGAVDKLSVEQHIRKFDEVLHIVWSSTPSKTGSYSILAGWQADQIQAKFKIF